jgi:hypothetical protein
MPKRKLQQEIAYNSNKIMTKIHPILNAMTFDRCLPVKIVLIALVSIVGCLSAPASAQPTPSPPETTPSPPQPEPPPQLNSYMGFGGVIGIQGGTTSLSQGTFSVLSKYVLTNNLALHSTSTIFGSSVSSTSLDLTFNQPIESADLPIVLTPFLGGGVLAYYENGTKIVPHITGGIDANTPFGVTATIRLEVGFIQDRKADIGVVFGLGKNF